MAVRVKVKNFQSLKDTEVVVDGMTTIMGPNNSGKTALMRAIRAVFTNPGGDKFIHYGEDECSVTLEFDDGVSVTWTKSRKRGVKPKYIINDGDPIYPGAGVPDELYEAVGIFPIKLGQESHWPNFAKQIVGQVFLMDKPGSVMAEAVADVNRVRKLNGALKDSDSERRKVESTLKVRKVDRDNLQAVVASYEGLDGLLDETKALEKNRSHILKIQKAALTCQELHGRFVASATQVESLQGVEEVIVPSTDAFQQVNEIERVKRWGARLRFFQATVEHLQGIEKVDVPSDDKAQATLQTLGEMSALGERVFHAQDAYDQFASFKKVVLPSLSSSQETLRGLQKVEELSGRLTPAITLYEALKGFSVPSLGSLGKDEKRVAVIGVIEGFKLNLDRADGGISSLKKDIEDKTQELEEIENEVAQLLEELGECPTCGLDFGGKHVHV